jgi:hypothetical protein
VGNFKKVHVWNTGCSTELGESILRILGGDRACEGKGNALCILSGGGNVGVVFHGDDFAALGWWGNLIGSEKTCERFDFEARRRLGPSQEDAKASEFSTVLLDGVKMR